MVYSYSRKNGALSQVPRGGWALKRLFTDLVIEGARESGLLDALDAVRSVSAKRSRGRAIVYSNEALLRAAALRILERQKYAKDFVAYLQTSKHARIVCDFKGERTPCEATISRFFRLLSEHRDAFGDVLTAVNLRVTALIAEGREMGDFADDAPPLGHALAIDSTDVKAFSDPSRRLHIDPSCPKPDKPDECRSALPSCCRPSDVKAAWGMKTDSKSKSGVIPFFGYKLHTICDAYYGTPLYALLLPANESDTKQLRPLRRRDTESVSVAYTEVSTCRQRLRLHAELRLAGLHWHHAYHRRPQAEEGEGEEPCDTRCRSRGSARHIHTGVQRGRLSCVRRRRDDGVCWGGLRTRSFVQVQVRRLLLEGDDSVSCVSLR